MQKNGEKMDKRNKYQEETDAINVLVNYILKAVDNKTVNCDKTYKSVIKEITTKGYVISDNSGQKRTVKCCIPNIELKVGQSVWVKEPMGKLRDIHICGVV